MQLHFLSHAGVGRLTSGRGRSGDHQHGRTPLTPGPRKRRRDSQKPPPRQPPSFPTVNRKTWDPDRKGEAEAENERERGLGGTREKQAVKKNKKRTGKEGKTTGWRGVKKKRLKSGKERREKGTLSLCVFVLAVGEESDRVTMATHSSRGSSQRLSRDLTCSICLDLFKQPVSLPCDHTFCETCINSYWTGPACKGGTASCPQCRMAFPGQSYRPNRIVANIVESYCQSLEESGQQCRGAGQARPPPLCLRHREELKLYCEEDQELVCLVCGVSQEHRSHTLASIEDAQSRYRVRDGNSVREMPKTHSLPVSTPTPDSMTALQSELNQALLCEREAEEEVKKLKEHTADLKHRIEAQFCDLHQFLYQEEKMLQVKLKTEERRELIRLDEYKAVLCVEISRLRRAIDEIEDKLREQDPFLLLRLSSGERKLIIADADVMWKKLSPASAIAIPTHSLSFSPPTEHQGPATEPLKFERPAHTVPSLCEGRFAGPLQYRVWKSLKGIIYPAPAAITFNASTSNPWLSLSPSLTCVRYQTFHNSVEDNPQRFNAALSLLGSQGFTHGQHYWEIEVYSSTVWTLGVARESVARKGVIKALPANGFWTLSLSYGVQYMAGTSPPTVLPLKERLARIGVYLDFKRGLVSFYNAENMAHLYTFQENFTETLYPYFNLGFLDKVHENEPLKVFLPKI
ncbi:hypothetical protein JZ751_012102 [Albula glossodonta]|uniref:Zinc-binding protein A33-like n=1 Tax=Albula glossodonta TaxID=121402 RepID=A0A8T2PRM6_9TELE|nr:hypothetical protein JZ751_012102 [Albula glossodonta]